MMDVIMLSLLLAGVVACFAEIFSDARNLLANGAFSLQGIKKYGRTWISLGSGLGTVALLLASIIDPSCPSISPATPVVHKCDTIKLRKNMLFGRIFYTLDGSDPLDSGIPYKEEIALHNAGQFITVTVRTRLMWKWSEPVSKTYYVIQHESSQVTMIKFCNGHTQNALNAHLVEGTVL